MRTRDSAKGLVAWWFCLFIVAGCSCAGIVGPGPSTVATGAVPVATRTPALLQTATPAPSLSVCIIEMPAQVQGDNTPITFVHFGEDAAQCALEVAQMNDPVHGSTTQGPAKVIHAIPSGTPICTVMTPNGIKYEIYGTLAAMQACGA